MVEDYVINGKLILLLRERKTTKDALDIAREQLAELIEKEQSIKHDLLVFDRKIQAAKAEWELAKERYLLDELAESALNEKRAVYDAAIKAENNCLDMMRTVNRTRADFTENKMKTLADACYEADRKVWAQVFNITREQIDAMHAMSMVARCWALCPDASGIGDYESLLKSLFPQPTTEQVVAVRAEIEQRYGSEER